MRKVSQNYKNCHNFRQGTFTLAVIFSFIFCQISFAKDLRLNKNNRSPASYTPDDQVQPVPSKPAIWLSGVLVEDDSGVLISMKDQFHQWQVTEDYVRNWDMGSTGIYKTPDRQAKKAYFDQQMLRYFDKRLSGEINRAEEGSTLHTVGQVRKALSPKAEARVSKFVKLKFKARVLEGNGTLVVENPYVALDANVNRTGRVRAHMEKDIEKIGVKASVDYEVSDSYWVTRLDRQLTEKVKASLYSVQSDGDLAFTSRSDKVVELLYNHSF